MKYYTATIPPTLAEKLKEKGMQIFIEQEWYSNGMPKAEKDCHKPMTKFCEVFDWLATRGIYISICHRETSVGIEWYPMVNGKCPRVIDGKEWQHSAEVAIEMALTLI